MGAREIFDVIGADGLVQLAAVVGGNLGEGFGATATGTVGNGGVFAALRDARLG